MFELSTVDCAIAHEESGICVREWTSETGAVRVRAYVGTAWSWIVWDGVASYRFRRGTHSVEALPAKDASPATVRDHYLRHILPLVMQANGFEALHASAVMSDRGVVGFCGECGTGKSTIAYAMSRRGYPQYADDVLVVEPVHGRVDALSLPFLPRLRVPAAQHFGTKLYRHLFSEQETHSERDSVAALFILERADDGELDPHIEQLDNIEALTALLSHAQRFDTTSFSGRKRSLQSYLDIMAAVPVFSVRFANAFERLDGLLDRLVEASGVACPEPCEAR